MIDYNDDPFNVEVPNRISPEHSFSDTERKDAIIQTLSYVNVKVQKRTVRETHFIIDTTMSQLSFYMFMNFSGYFPFMRLDPSGPQQTNLVTTFV